jgi:hypothetical protein
MDATEIAEGAGREAAVSGLARLGEAFGAHGFSHEVICPTSAPAFVRVANTSVGRMRDDITCAPCGPQDELWFFWSWGERMVPVTDLAGAVRRIGYVLATSEPAQDRP